MADASGSEDKLPLQDEAKARRKWRGEETWLEGDGDDVGLPASEIDPAKRSPGGDRDGRPGEGRPGEFPPPD